jgi:hypothetical protein
LGGDPADVEDEVVGVEVEVVTVVVETDDEDASVVVAEIVVVLAKAVVGGSCCTALKAWRVACEENWSEGLLAGIIPRAKPTTMPIKAATG